MPSQLKSDTTRANEAKSRGPNSAARRETSSRNCLPCGPASSLCCENQSISTAWLPSTNATYQPVTRRIHVVMEMATAPKGIERLRTAEASLIDLKMVACNREL